MSICTLLKKEKEDGVVFIFPNKTTKPQTTICGFAFRNEER